jgi:hypothetical protein
MHDLSYTSTSPSVDDARYRTKDYWDTYIDSDNLNNHPYLVCYAHPDYPLTHVFNTKGRHIIFAIDTPRSTALKQADQTAYGYMEHVPTHILTLDTELNHLAEAELRTITEDNPFGSQRNFETRGSTIHNYGSTIIYDTEVVLQYVRDTT